ncbi:hypothetical protein OYC64_010292 [Pagothenia borchgrevinki]
MKRKLPAEHAVQEELRLKNRMLDLMEEASSRSAASMDRMNNTMDSINGTIQNGLSLMSHLMQAPPYTNNSGYGHFQVPSYPPRRPHTATPRLNPSVPHTNPDTPQQQSPPYSFRRSLYEEDQ